MEHVRSALASSVATGKDVNDLLRVIRLLLRLCEGRLTAHAQLGSTPPEGSYRSLAADINALHALSGALGDVASGLALSARDSLVGSCAHFADESAEQSQAEDLRGACDQTLQALETALSTIRTVNEESQKQRDVLLETALRRDLSPTLRNETDQLLQRIGDQSRGAAGET